MKILKKSQHIEQEIKVGCEEDLKEPNVKIKMSLNVFLKMGILFTSQSLSLKCFKLFKHLKLKRVLD